MTYINPFFHRGPIRDPNYFWDHQSTIARLFTLLQTGQSISLIGPESIGKSSLLFHLARPDIYTAHGFAPDQICFVYLDGDGCRALAPPILYTVIAEKLYAALGAANLHIEELPLTETVVTLRQLEQAIGRITAGGIRLILLVDGFDALSANPRLDLDFFAGLRSLAMQYDVTYVIASVRSIFELTTGDEQGETCAFFSFLAQIRLGLWSAGEAKAMLQRWAANADVNFTAQTLDSLFDLAGPHPLLLQIAGYHAFDLQRALGRPLDRRDYPEITQRFLSEAEDRWRYLWDNLSVEDQRFLALLPLVQATDVERARRLCYVGLVRQSDHSHLAYLSPAFEEFVRRQSVSGIVQASSVTIVPEERVALVNGRTLALSPITFGLLQCLVTNADQVVSHRELETQIWLDEFVEDPERLKMAIKTLRRALGTNAKYIQNVRGAGYKFASVN